MNTYEITGPFFGQRRLEYVVRRVIDGKPMATAITCGTLTTALQQARRLRTLDAETMPERADWEIIKA